MNTHFIKTYKHIVRALAAVMIAALMLPCGADLHAASAAEKRLAQHRAMPVESNLIAGWPTGPVVGAESAILMEAETGTILYSKNIHQKQYPASTTKLLTTLLVTEHCALNEIVTFSHKAVFDTPRDSSHIAMDVGQELTIEQSLQAILIRSANEVSYAVAEHISGTTDWSVFAEMMNNRAKELGCLNSNFANPNGLPHDDHYTTAYDLAKIGQAFFQNELLCNITLTRRMQFPVTEKLPLGKLENNLMKIIPGAEYAYPYIIGCKTGYTDSARSALVSAAEKDGMRLICVVLKDENPYQYEDTIALFNYGFSNFEKVNIAQAETKYQIADEGLFYGGNDLMGSSEAFLSIDKKDFVVLPRNITLADTESEISYENLSDTEAARIYYSFQGVPIGSAALLFAEQSDPNQLFDVLKEGEGDPAKNDPGFVLVNTLAIISIVIAILIFLFLIWFVIAFLKAYQNSAAQRRHIRRKNLRRRRRQARSRDWR